MKIRQRGLGSSLHTRRGQSRAGGPKWKATVMSDDEKIYVDAGRPAMLNSGGVSTDCPTLQEAVIAWHKLPLEQKQKATIKLMGGIAYAAGQIERLHHGPRSPI